MKINATVKLVLDPKSRDDKKYTKLQITFNRKSRIYTVGCSIKLTKEQFSNKRLGETKKVLEDAEPKYNKAKEIVNSLGQDFTFNKFYQHYKSENFGAIGKEEQSTAIEKMYENYFAGKSINSATEDSYRTGLNWILRYNDKIKLEDITEGFLTNLEKFIKEEHEKDYFKERGIKNHDISPTSLAFYMKGLRAVYNHTPNRILIKNAEYPFGKNKYQIKSGTKKTKKSVPVEDFAKFVNYTTDDLDKQFAWDFFMLSFQCNGMNLGDVFSLRNRSLNGHTLTFIRIKTKDTKDEAEEIVVKLSDNAYRIIEKHGTINSKYPDNFVFPFYREDWDEIHIKNSKKRWLKKINSNLKEICRELDITEFTSKKARHTFATIMRDENVPIAVIQKALGHSDVKTTQNYLDSLSNKKMEEIKDKITDFVSSLKE